MNILQHILFELPIELIEMKKEESKIQAKEVNREKDFVNEITGNLYYVRGWDPLELAVFAP